MRACDLCRSTDRPAREASFTYPNPDKDDQKDYTLNRRFDICEPCTEAMLDFTVGTWYSRLKVAPFDVAASSTATTSEPVEEEK